MDRREKSIQSSITSIHKERKAKLERIEIKQHKKESTLETIEYNQHKSQPNVILLSVPEVIEERYAALNLLSRVRKNQEILIRAFDVVGSIFILLFTLPAMLVVALLIKMFSLGPVLYKQERVGKDGRIFILCKFRTMVNNAAQLTGPFWSAKDYPRVTRLGRFLRRTRLDDLPQLFNVLWGDMSLVGPRPERPYFVKRNKTLQGIRLAVKPGLTGLAQIRSFHDLKPDHKIKYDYLYIQKRSLLLNAYILLKTIPLFFTKRGS